MNLDEFGLLMMLGVRVREVADLDEEAIWVPRHRLLLIDAGISRSKRTEVAELFLVDAFATAPA